MKETLLSILVPKSMPLSQSFTSLTKSNHSLIKKDMSTKLMKIQAPARMKLPKNLIQSKAIWERRSRTFLSL